MDSLKPGQFEVTGEWPGPGPRQAKWSSVSILMCGLLVAAVLVDVWIIFDYSLPSQRAEAEKARLLQQVGGEVAGKLTSLSASRGRHGRVVVKYTFLAEGEVIAGSARFSSGFTWDPGVPLRVRYVRAHPEIHRLRGEEVETYVGAFMFLAGVGAGLIWFVVAQVLRVRLCESGRIASAEVMGTRVGAKGARFATYSFRDDRQASWGREVRSNAGVGDVIPVVYDPAQPSRSAPLEQLSTWVELRQ
jgi:hypothetical protein